jgi:hypothetical protein
MIKQGNSGLPGFLKVPASRELRPYLSGDVLAALKTILTLNQNPWRYKCPSDILLLACA